MFNPLPRPFQGVGLNLKIMYRVSIKKSLGGKWKTLWEDESLGTCDIDLKWMLEKCVIYAYKVEWVEPAKR